MAFEDDRVKRYMSINSNSVNFDTPNNYKNNWQWACVLDMYDVAEYMLTHVWSNCLWSDGVRLQKDFRAAFFAAIDVDSGYSLEQAINELSDTLHVVGTTKSHGIKGDRFRIVIPFARPIKDVEEYRENIKLLISRYDGDTAVCDAARFFWPCTKIVSINNDKWSYPEDVKPVQVKKDVMKKYNQYKVLRVTPPWVMQALNFGVPDGQRNNYIYSISKTLTLCGMSHEDIYNRIKSSKVPKKEAPENEIASAVKNGVKRGQEIIARECPKND